MKGIDRRRDAIITASVLGTVGLLALGLGRVAQLEVAPASELLDHIGRRTRSSLELAIRGPIVDRRGRVLAQTVIGHDLAVDVKVLLDEARAIAGDGAPDPRPSLAAAIASVSSLDEAEMLGLLRKRDDARFVKLADGGSVDFLDVDAIRNLRIGFTNDRWSIEISPSARPAGDRSRRIKSLVLAERPVRHVLPDSDAASIVGAVTAMEWTPPPAELDRLASDVRIDLAGIEAWHARSGESSVDVAEALAPGIAEALGADADEIERRLRRADGRPLTLARAEHLDPARIRRVRSVEIGGRTVPRSLLVDIVDEDGHDELRRRYPEQRGASGVEAARDGTLRPTHGGMTRVVAAGGQTILVEEGRYEPGRDGMPVTLTIDLEIQRLVRERLQQAIDEHLAVGGWAVVVDPQTGEILAAVDLFDNEEAERRGGWPEGYRDAGRDQLGPEFARNRVWTDCFDPGSTFKSFFWAWATDLGRARPDEIIDVPGGGMAGGSKMFGRRRIRDVYGYGGNPNRPSTWSLCLEKSINTGMATVAQRVSDAEMVEMFDRFGFTHPSGINLGYEGTLAHPPVEAWVPNYTRLSASFGQAVSITPLSLTRGYCAFARNDGRLPILSLTSTGVRPYATPSTPTVSAATALETREILARQFETIRRRYYEERDLESIPYTAFGKSATAQWFAFEEDPETGESRNIGYHEDRYLSSYVGGAPFDDPRVVVALGLQDPLKGMGANADLDGRGHLGSYAAGRPVHDLLGQVLTYLGVPGDRPREEPAG